MILFFGFVESNKRRLQELSNNEEPPEKGMFHGKNFLKNV